MHSTRTWLSGAYLRVRNNARAYNSVPQVYGLYSFLIRFLEEKMEQIMLNACLESSFEPYEML